MTSRRSIAAGIIALIFLLAGCSGDDGDGDTNPAQLSDQNSDENSAGVAEDDEALLDDDEATNGESASDANAAIDACTLVTKEEAEAVVGQEIELESSGDSGGFCTYDTVTEDLSIVMIQVGVQPGALSNDVELKTVAELVADGLGHSGELAEISGLGDGAYLADGGLIPTIFVASGDDLLNVGAMGTEDDVAALKELAEIALGRL